MDKKIKIVMGAFVSVAGILLLASSAFADLTKVADNVYAYVDVKNASPLNSFGANTGIVVGSDGVLVIDTLVSAKEAQRFIADIRKITDKPIKYVVNTHYHLDHAFGNSEFAKLGAKIVATDADRRNLAQYGEETLKGVGNFGLTAQDMEGTYIVLPDITFHDKMTIHLGDETIELIYVMPSHTTGNLLVYIPRHKILFTGDILFTDFHPYMADCDVKGWIENLDFIDKMDVEAIIPGHGPLSTKKDVEEIRDYLRTFDMIALEMAAKGKDAEAIAAKLAEKLPKRSQNEWTILRNINAKYLK